MTPTADAIAAAVDGVNREVTELTDRTVRLIAVTKGHPVAVAQAALAAGLADLGENYAQELTAKHNSLSPEERSVTRWHFIGGLQRNKVRGLVGAVSLWHTLDSVRLIAEVGHRAPGAHALIQVNISGHPTRPGCRGEHLGELLAAAADSGVVVRGLMGVASPGEPREVESQFTSLVRLADTFGLPERCIGMSGDFPLAVAAGSTMIRIGNRIFGSRPVRRTT